MMNHQIGSYTYIYTYKFILVRKYIFQRCWDKTKETQRGTSSHTDKKHVQGEAPFDETIETMVVYPTKVCLVKGWEYHYSYYNWFINQHKWGASQGGAPKIAKLVYNSNNYGL